jgi:hypothetical protein
MQGMLNSICPPPFPEKKKSVSFISERTDTFHSTASNLSEKCEPEISQESYRTLLQRAEIFRVIDSDVLI